MTKIIQTRTPILIIRSMYNVAAYYKVTLVSCMYVAEPFDNVSWIVILIVCIPIAAVSIFVCEYMSPLGLNRGSPCRRGILAHIAWLAHPLCVIL